MIDATQICADEKHGGRVDASSVLGGWPSHRLEPVSRLSDYSSLRRYELARRKISSRSKRACESGRGLLCLPQSIAWFYFCKATSRRPLRSNPGQPQVWGTGHPQAWAATEIGSVLRPPARDPMPFLPDEARQRDKREPSTHWPVSLCCQRWSLIARQIWGTASTSLKFAVG